MVKKMEMVYSGEIDEYHVEVKKVNDDLVFGVKKGDQWLVEDSDFVVIQKKSYATPADVVNQTGIEIAPPATWEEFEDLVEKHDALKLLPLRELDAYIVVFLIV